MSSFPPSVAIVDSDPNTLHTYSTILRSSGIKDIVTIQDSRELPIVLKERSFSLILLDLFHPHLSGLELLKFIVTNYSEIPVIVVTALKKIDTAVECMKIGAYDYLVKPVKPEKLVATVKGILDVKKLEGLENEKVFSEIITTSQKMFRIFKYIEIVAKTDQPVLITGETGTGKELIAKAIHKLSGKAGQFVAVNIAGVDDTVFSDTLFGHKKGAYTGAITNREGLIAKASGGTLFLDEIGDLSEASQLKLLRVIQERIYYPLGSDTPKSTDARLIVATNQDIFELVSKGRFRKDLFYRLKTHHIHLPPLRERKEDIPFLLNYFIKEAALYLGKKPPIYPQELIILLMNYSFPGNIRELKMMVYDAVARCRGRILSLESFKEIIDLSETVDRDLKAEIIKFFIQMRFPEKLPTLREMERMLIEEALRRAKGNQGIAALMLGITRQALNKRLRKLT